jgi:hypothetical protein
MLYLRVDVCTFSGFYYTAVSEQDMLRRDCCIEFILLNGRVSDPQFKSLPNFRLPKYRIWKHIEL